jgi:hypothetical protein
MENLERITALQLASDLDKWKMYNPLFRGYIPVFNKVFDQGTLLNLDYYQTRNIDEEVNNTYEDNFWNLIFINNNTSFVQTHLLIGNVGAGKTSFVRYITTMNVPSSTLGIYLNTWNIFEGTSNINKRLEESFISATENAVIKTKNFYSSPLEYYYDIYRSRGLTIPEKPSLEEQLIINNNISEKSSMKTVVDYLLWSDKFDRILIVIDNLDENSSEAFNASMAFRTDLESFFNIKNLNKQVVIILPIREFTANTYHDTNIHHPIQLPRFKNESLVVIKKVEELKDEIEKIAGEIRYDVSYSFAGSSLQNRRIEICNKNIIEFVKMITMILLPSRNSELDEKASHEIEFFKMLTELSSGNYKILIEAMYSLFHSCKLEIIPLFQRVFTPNQATDARQWKALIPFDKVCDCLMSIHYPFYDVKTSCIMNVFNAGLSAEINEYQNTLVVTRLIYLLSNLKSDNNKITKKALIEKYEQYGYAEEHVSKALEKCMSYGLLSTNCGFRFDHLGDTTEISCSNTANFYIKVIFDPNYLQYVCEDTPMPKKFIIPLEEKYVQPCHMNCPRRMGGSSFECSKECVCTRGNKQKRLEGVTKLIQFIKEEEERERVQIINRGQRVDDFYYEFSTRKNRKGSSLSVELENNVMTKINNILR